MGLPDDRPIPQGQDAADPSMEDILASIRRILNDGDAGTEQSGPYDDDPTGSPAEHDLPSPHGASPDGDDDVFLLDTAMMIDDPHPDPHPDTGHEPFETHLQDDPDDAQIPFTPPPLVAPETANATSTSMGALVRALHDRHIPIARGNSPTLEDIVRDEMRPLVKAWLDEHLPPLVERLVRAEIERVVGRAVG